LDRGTYEVRVQRATEGERRYMRAMAELGSGPYRSGQVAEKAGQSVTQASHIVERLEPLLEGAEEDGVEVAGGPSAQAQAQLHSQP
jgi:hypothetical protein